jgi:hypothetical protein
MVKRREIGDLRPSHPSGLTLRCLFIAALIIGLLFVIDQAFSKPKTINGACGSANGVRTTTAPTTNLGSARKPSTVTGTGPLQEQRLRMISTDRRVARRGGVLCVTRVMRWTSVVSR